LTEGKKTSGISKAYSNVHSRCVETPVEVTANKFSFSSARCI